MADPQRQQTLNDILSGKTAFSWGSSAATTYGTQATTAATVPLSVPPPQPMPAPAPAPASLPAAQPAPRPATPTVVQPVEPVVSAPVSTVLPSADTVKVGAISFNKLFGTYVSVLGHTAPWSMNEKSQADYGEQANTPMASAPAPTSSTSSTSNPPCPQPTTAQGFITSVATAMATNPTPEVVAAMKQYQAQQQGLTTVTTQNRGSDVHTIQLAGDKKTVCGNMLNLIKFSALTSVERSNLIRQFQTTCAEYCSNPAQLNPPAPNIESGYQLNAPLYNLPSLGYASLITGPFNEIVHHPILSGVAGLTGAVLTTMSVNSLLPEFEKSGHHWVLLPTGAYLGVLVLSSLSNFGFGMDTFVNWIDSKIRPSESRDTTATAQDICSFNNFTSATDSTYDKLYYAINGYKPAS